MEDKPIQTPQTRSHRTIIVQTAGYYAAFFMLGAVIASLGPTLPALAKNVQTSLSQIGALLSGRSLGYLLGSLSIGRLYDRFPGHRILVIVLIGMGASVALLPIVSAFWLLTLVIFLVGFALGSVDVGSNTLVAWTYRRKAGPYLNALYLFGGIGGFLSPLVIGKFLSASGGLNWAYWSVALMGVPAVLLLANAPSPPTQRHESTQENRQALPLMVAMFGLLFFIYVGSEVSFGGWIFSYIAETNLGDTSMASMLTSMFWLAVTFGRVIAIPLTARIPPQKYIAINLVGAFISVLVMLLFPGILTSLWVGTLGLGLALASLFPTSFALAERQFPITGRLAGILWALGSSGAIIIPWLVGYQMDRSGPGAMLTILTIGMGAGLLVFLMLLHYISRQKTPNS